MRSETLGGSGDGAARTSVYFRPPIFTDIQVAHHLSTRANNVLRTLRYPGPRKGQSPTHHDLQRTDINPAKRTHQAQTTPTAKSDRGRPWRKKMLENRDN